MTSRIVSFTAAFALFSFIAAPVNAQDNPFANVGKASTSQAQKNFDAEAGFQHDADLVRLEHLAYWTGLIEEYKTKTGHYPFQDKLTGKDQPGLLRIATKEQAQFFTKRSGKYKAKFDNNADGHFQEFTMKDFVVELEAKLGKAIDEKYDIQRVPDKSPVGYNYFVTPKGYLFWIPCISCGVTPISTLLMDGITPTVNIASPGMGDKVIKALTRGDMLKDPVFIQWQSSAYIKEGFVRKIEQENLHDSKK